MVKTTSSSQLKKIVVLPGDNIGKEVCKEAVRVLETITSLCSSKYDCAIEMVEQEIGGSSIDKYGVPLHQHTLDAIDSPDTVAVLLGAVGGPKWDSVSEDVRPEKGLLQLRKHLNCFANLRPCFFPSKSLISASVLKNVDNIDFIIVRELCGGIYFGEKKEYSESDDYSFDKEEYSTFEIERITRIACLLAIDFAKIKGSSPRIISVDKANVLASSRHWRKIVSKVVQQFPEIELVHQYVDSAAMLLIKNPEYFNGIVLTNNIFGDILSDEASALVGSLGLLPSASISGWFTDDKQAISKPFLYEPIHGSAPDIAGKGISNPLGAILSVAMLLRLSLGWNSEAEILEECVKKTLDDQAVGGFGYRTADLGGTTSTKQFGDKVCELLREKLGLIMTKRIEPSIFFPKKSSASPLMEFKERPLNLVEKILLQHLVQGDKSLIIPGKSICVNVDWTIASELTWKGMEKTYNEIGRPKVWRNDRFWLAVDHTVDPSINHLSKPKELIEASTKFALEAGLKDFYGPNQTILHTDFYRFRAQPGMIVIGADSHTCSAGGLGCLAVGLGAADVVIPLVTGQTWFTVPETVRINFTGQPPRGIGGKDVILWILGELKRNTVAFERAVEFGGPGCKYLSCDSRFAIANMATEFGGLAGVFEADEITASFIQKRKNHKDQATYFRADDGAMYADSYDIDLSRIQSMMALYPNPDNVVPISEMTGMKLDGVFIGACTTGEEDLILAALVLEAGFKRGFVPCMGGKRKVTPGSVTILAKLKLFGLIDIYKKANFEIGAPGCSYCLGIAADKAGEGEVWLTSQNRNFKNRMGKGSFGNLASASSVAASSFEMKVTDPAELLALVDWDKFIQISRADDLEQNSEFIVSEPVLNENNASVKNLAELPGDLCEVVTGRVQKFGDNIDTDAIIPAEFMPGTSDEDLGTHCFQYVRPEFRQLVSEGFNIVVAGCGFGSGSSREEAPRALLGCGVQVVIAKSFAFIYGRNQYNMALLGITLDKFEEFYELVSHGSLVRVDCTKSTVEIVDNDGATKKCFNFSLGAVEKRLISGGGVCQMYKKYDNGLFQALMSNPTKPEIITEDSSLKSRESKLKIKPSGKICENQSSW